MPDPSSMPRAGLDDLASAGEQVILAEQSPPDVVAVDAIVLPEQQQHSGHADLPARPQHKPSALGVLGRDTRLDARRLLGVAVDLSHP